MKTSLFKLSLQWGIAALGIIILLLSMTACGASPISDTTLSPGTVKQTEPALPAVIGQAQAADLMEQFTPREVPARPVDARFKADLYNFSASLLREIYATDEEGKTTLISPLSILTALSMTANGAREETLKQMEDVLFGGQTMTLDDLNEYLHSYLNALPSTEESSFAFANSIWFRDMEGFTVEQDFLQKNVDYYQAGVFKAPFDETTVRDINDWVSTHTHHMIPSLLDKLGEKDRMLLINALVFEAKWADPFDSQYSIHPGTFSCLDGSSVTVSQMNGSEYLYLSDENCTGFMKPYQGDRYHFVALLPDKDVAFDDFVASISAEKLEKLFAGVEHTKTLIRMPKFSYDYSRSLKNILASLGMPLAFTDAANFDGIGNSRDMGLKIGDVLHKTHIDVDNEGTRAAAVTAVMVAECSAMPMEPKTVYLDRPFLYMIIDTENELPIFIGTLTRIETP